MCSRQVCDGPDEVKIYNEPSTTDGYRLYCRPCAKKIVDFAIEYDGIDLRKPKGQQKLVNGVINVIT